ncbi:MAG TPA: sugar phosphate isomerase/epimerase family protein [Clostridiales bacterium]|nr:sugar phosphate isomerase/epimerase family protein [Clostridiales bacterium]HOL79982.1 sugar phosphate isomerase/epimerase family protein [Clostridiales bacterium]HPP68049.1 sugar phosphate isomerase/epimerase family protein [Clostridiales bacterium]
MSVKFGMCTSAKDLERIKKLAEIGYDYVEINFTGMTEMPEDEFEAFLKVLEETNFKCEAANCFIPGEIKLTGENVDYDKVREFVSKGMARAERAGIKSVVFGSGGARRVPEGFPMDKAYEQLVKFLKEYAGPIAARHGVAIAIEPLRSQETNIINKVSEGVELARKVGLPNVKGLGDIYHMATEYDSDDELAKFRGEIQHTHISHPLTRYAPKKDDGYDYSVFLKAVIDSGCERCSVEGRLDSFPEDAVEALEVLKNAVKNI